MHFQRQSLRSSIFRYWISAILFCLSTASLQAAISIEQFHGKFSLNQSTNPDSDKPNPISPSIVFTKNDEATSYSLCAYNMYFRLIFKQEYVVSAIVVQKHLPVNPKSNDYKQLVLAAWPDVASKELKFVAKTIENWVAKNSPRQLLLITDLMKAQNIGGAMKPEGNVQESQLLRKVDPIYPREAMMNRISGIVKLSVSIDERGIVDMIKPISGPRILIPAALAAVQQWQYSPTLLDGEPVSAEATVTVKFNRH